MTVRHPRWAGLAVAVGCGLVFQAFATWSVAAAGSAPTVGLTSSVTAAGGTWALLPMDGFWELFLLPNGGGAWSLRTPPGVADNGGLVVSAGSPSSLLVGFRPSQNLKYSPLATTGDGGQTWTPGIFPGALARGPDALAASSGGRLLVVSQDSDDTVWTGPAPGGSWARLTGLAALAHAPGVRTCDPAAVTAAAFTASGTPVVGTRCRHHGAVGIVALGTDGPRLAGPTLSAALRSATVSVLRLSTTAGGLAALLSVQAGSRSFLLAAWEQGEGSWTVSPELRIGGGSVASTLLGPGSSLGVLLAGTGPKPVPEMISGPGSSWVRLPPAPEPASVIAAGVGGDVDALGTSGQRLEVWRLPAGTRSWAKSQTLKVPIQFGSSS
jgi:hypothetical protein